MKAFRKTVRDARMIGRMGSTLWPHARPYPGLLSGIVIFGIAALAMRMAQPWPLKWLFNGLTGGEAPLAPAPSVLAAAFIVLTIAAAGMEAFQGLVVYSLANKSVAGFRLRLFGHLMALPITYHHKKSPGELLTRAVSDTARIRRGIAGIILKVIQSTGHFAVVMAVLFVIDPGLACGVLAAGILAVGTMTLGARRILRAARKNRRREGQLADVVEENLQSVREVQTFNFGRIDPRFEASNAKSLKGEQKLRRLEAGMLFRVELLLTLALGVAVVVGTWRIEAGVLSAGDLVLFLTYLLNLYRPLAQSAQQSAQVGRMAACADRLLTILDREPLTDRPGALEPAQVSGSIEFEGVGVEAPRSRHGSRRRILQEVSIRIDAGMRVGVMGENGSGKSSLLALMARLADPTEGRILLDGRDVREYKLSWLRRQFNVVHQDPLLVGSTLRDNLAWGDPESTAAAVEGARLEGLLAGMRDGIESRVSRNGRIFSGGERQRIAVARALARDGRMWLLDEPANGLDAASHWALTETLLETTQGHTTLWVTHDASLAARLDRLLVLESGRVTYFGSPGDFQPDATGKEVADASSHPGRG